MLLLVTIPIVIMKKIKKYVSLKKVIRLYFGALRSVQKMKTVNTIIKKMM